ncbi:DUF2061 domain-containing protein [Henriciella aquimarina]|uniref:DUF2061 domain-containing protein n=1 Tax=Henriciella aquimarina TaxID=545261 RepID=UPI000A0317FB|nr:DUF2061 domain-containing protein [Henriciella aquimarina]
MPRSLLKTCTYSLMHLSVAITVAFALTGNWAVAFSIGLIEPFVQTAAYTVHERAWEKWMPGRQARIESVHALPPVNAPQDGPDGFAIAQPA